MSKKVGLFLCPKGGGYANGIQNATLAKIDEAGEKLQNIGSSVENVGKKFLPVTAAASSNANTNSPWWARRSSTVRLSPVRWGSRQRIRKIVSAVQQFVDKLNSMDWISKRQSCPWYYIGIDWQREKWQSGLGSKFIHQGEKNAAKYADEVIVLSKGVQDYFKETYGRETHFIPNGVNAWWEGRFWRLLLTCPKSCCIYIARAGSSNLALPARSLS